MALNKATDVPAADWLSQTHVKNYRHISRVVIRFFSEVEIPMKHSSLYNKLLSATCLALKRMNTYFGDKYVGYSMSSKKTPRHSLFMNKSSSCSNNGSSHFTCVISQLWQSVNSPVFLCSSLSALNCLVSLIKKKSYIFRPLKSVALLPQTWQPRLLQQKPDPLWALTNPKGHIDCTTNMIFRI